MIPPTGGIHAEQTGLQSGTRGSSQCRRVPPDWPEGIGRPPRTVKVPGSLGDTPKSSPGNGLGTTCGGGSIDARPSAPRYDGRVPPAHPDPRTDALRENLRGIERRMAAARRRGAHSAPDVRLVVVTKSVGTDLYAPLAAAGVTDIGENRVQSAAARKPKAPAALRWHGIGHLQRNKAALALETFDVLHAVDSPRLAARLDTLLAGSGRRVAAYLQVNSAEDPDKHGVRPAEALAFYRAVASHTHLLPVGFMTMGKLGAEDADLRSTFRILREIRDEAVGLALGAQPPAGLSMGMSNDFETAIEEGATVVRVGRAVFDGVPSSEAPAAEAGAAPVPGEPS